MDKAEALGRVDCFVVDLDGTILDRPASLPGEANTEALSVLSSGGECLGDLIALSRKVSAAVTKGKGIIESKTRQFKTLLGHLGRKDDGLAERMFDQYMRHYLSCCELYPEVKSVLSALSGLGVHIGLITNSPDDVVTAVLRYFRIHVYFDFLAAASIIRHPKPSPQFARALVELAVWPPNAMVLAGDGDEDEAMAAAVGATFCRVVRDRRGLSASSTFEASDLAEIFDRFFRTAESPRSSRTYAP